MLDNIYKKHKYWVNWIKTKGCPNHLAEDFVQDLYLKMHERFDCYKNFAIEGEISEGFFATCLRNMVYNYLKSFKKKAFINFTDYAFQSKEGDLNVLDPVYEDNFLDLEGKYAFDKIVSKVEEIIDSFEYDYDKNLAREYFFTNKSMRSLSKDTGIKTSSIFISIKHYKSFISYKLGEDIEDYFNKDFNLIN